MEFQECLSMKKELYNLFLCYIDNEQEDVKNDDDDDYVSLISFIKEKQISEKHDELKGFLHLISKIEKHHYRGPCFYHKLERIFHHLNNDIHKLFSNSDLFDLFKKNKKILVFFFQNKILRLNKYIVNFILNYDDEKKYKYCHYFYHEIKDLIDESKRIKIEEEMESIEKNILYSFQIRRETGENDKYICKMIREDLIDEFVSYVSQTNLNLNCHIQQSLFETNSFLAKRNPTLIEYAAFFGSMQIIRFLFVNKVQLGSSLWIYAIHGGNPELIHFLETNGEKPTNILYEICFKEAIKCHHNNLANYIQNFYLDNNGNENSNYYEKHSNPVFDYENGNDFIQNADKLDENASAYCFRYHNWEFLDENINDVNMIYYLIKYDYIELVKLQLCNNEIDLNKEIILINIFLLIMFLINLLMEFKYFFFIKLFCSMQHRRIIMK